MKFNFKKIININLINEQNRKIIIYIATIFTINILFMSSVAQAATKVYFETNVKQVYTGDNISIDLKLASDESVNVVNGTITYDKDKLKIESINIDGSLLSLWPTPPFFDNNRGQLTFVGGVPNGFKGENGEIIKITFLAKKEGTAKLDFQDIFSVFANDGLGTSVNPQLHPISLVVVKKPIKLIFEEKWQFLTTEAKKPNNIALILFLVLFVVSILVIILIRSKRVAKR